MPKKKSMSKRGREVDMMNGCSGRYSNCGYHAGSVYGLGMIGALVYYIQQADGFWMGVLGVLKAIVWPAFFVYKLLGM